MTLVRDLLYSAVSIGALEINRVLEGVMKRTVQRLTGVLVIALGLTVGLIAVGFFLASAFLAMCPVLGPCIASLLTGSGALLLCIVIVVVGRSLIR